MSARYINDRKLPDKAIDVIDEERLPKIFCRPHRKQVIGQKEVENTIATMARIPQNMLAVTINSIAKSGDRSQAHGIWSGQGTICTRLGYQAVTRRAQRAGKAGR